MQDGVCEPRYVPVPEASPPKYHQVPVPVPVKEPGRVIKVPVPRPPKTVGKNKVQRAGVNVLT